MRGIVSLGFTFVAGYAPSITDRGNAVVTEERCLTRLLADTPSETDSFGSHERVARAIGEVVQTESGGRAIGLEGGWGLVNPRLLGSPPKNWLKRKIATTRLPCSISGLTKMIRFAARSWKTSSDAPKSLDGSKRTNGTADYLN